MSGIDWRPLSGALVLAVALGSLHAYSVLLGPLEAELAISRTATGLAYSIAIVSLTLAVLAGPGLLTRLGPSLAALLAGTGGAVGLALAASAGSGPGLVIGFGCVFGFANGIGYMLFLDRSAAAMPGRQGLAVGVATAAYGLGAMVFSLVLDEAAGASSGRIALVMLGGIVLVAGALGWLAFRGGSASASPGSGPGTPAPRATLLLWLVYFLGATGGLMAIGHAAGIFAARGASAPALAIAPILLASGNILGSIAGGWRAESIAGRHGFCAICAVSALALLLILLEPMALLIVGACYGALIAFVPAYIARVHGPERSSAVFGRVFTAWGAAGLLGPWAAGIIYDATGTYTIALLLASGLAAAGAVVSLWVRDTG